MSTLLKASPQRLVNLTVHSETHQKPLSIPIHGRVGPLKQLGFIKLTLRLNEDDYLSCSPIQELGESTRQVNNTTLTLLFHYRV